MVLPMHLLGAEQQIVEWQFEQADDGIRGPAQLWNGGRRYGFAGRPKWSSRVLARMRERRESWWKEAGLSNSAGSSARPASRSARALNTLLPHECFLCLAASNEQLLCPACRDSLPIMPAERCPICALPTPGAAVCGACLKRPPHFDESHAVFRYEFPVDTLIHALKYGHRLASADFLATALLEAAPGARPDLIIPVPLAAQNAWPKRGFNQAARTRAAAWREPADATARHPPRRPRHRDTTPQASLPWKERAKKHPPRLRAATCDLSRQDPCWWSTTS
jgi:predicted amidophosphoribosyltransferase